MPDWEEESDDGGSTAASPPSRKAPIKPVKKWTGEDEEESSPASDWEESSSEEESPKPAAPAAPPKKKGTLKAKLAEKEAAKAARRAAGEDSDEEYDSDAVLDPREKARLDKERELNADLDNAAALLGSAALGGTSSSELDSLISSNPKTKEEFHALSAKIVEYVIKRHQNKPLYASFIEHHVRALADPLKDVEVRKVASGLTTLANEKQKEARDKASGKKKPKATAKPGLGAAKLSSKLDTNVYDDALDDFGAGADDFM